MMNSRKLAKI